MVKWGSGVERPRLAEETQVTITSTGLIEERIVAVGGRSTASHTTRTFHADADCDRIAVDATLLPGTSQDAAWDCDWCVDQGSLYIDVIDDARPIPGEDIPLPADPRKGRIDGGRSGARRNQFGDARTPTEPQERYIRDLLRKLGSDADAWIADATSRGVWTRRESSRLIDGLKGELAQVGPDPAVKDERRANRYAGKCVKCGNWVDAEAGYLTKDANGKWAAEHKGECPEVVATPERSQASVNSTEPPEGIHLLDDVIFKVQIAKQGSGNLYAKRLDVRVVPGEVRANGEQMYAGHWEYEGRSRNFWKLSTETLLSVEDAAHFGHLYGICGVCGADLTKEESIERGIGPVCYGRIS